MLPLNGLKIYLATEPVDFRKGMDGLAGHVMTELELDPFNGAVFIFRSKRANKLKMIVWDGTGMVLIHKRIYGRGFELWPKLGDTA